MITFSHSGGMGDILYSLYFCKQLSEYLKQEKFNLHIQTDVHDMDMQMQSHPFKNVRMTEAAAEYMKPLLFSQSYINEITVGKEKPVGNFIDLDRFRQEKLNFAAGMIQNWYYNYAPVHLPREFWKPVLSVEPDYKYKDKIILILTERYLNVFTDINVLEKYKDSLVFMGLPYEYTLFCKDHFKIEFCPVENMLQAARFMKGTKGVCGNPSGNYSIAECLKVNRVVISPEFTKTDGHVFPGPHNVNPFGGWFEDVGTTEKLLSGIENLLKEEN